MACCDSEVDLGSVPLVALNMSVRKKLGLYLNPRNTVAADWMVVAEAMGFTYLEIKNYEALKRPIIPVLEDWQARCTDATVGKLLSILTDVERNDIVEDLRPVIGALVSFGISTFLKKRSFHWYKYIIFDHFRMKQYVSKYNESCIQNISPAEKLYLYHIKLYSTPHPPHTCFAVCKLIRLCIVCVWFYCTR